MLKRWMRNWLGIDELENTVWQQHGDQLALDSAYDNLKNLYDSNRMRIDNFETRLTEAQNRTRNLATKTLSKISVLEEKQKPVTKKPTPKKGK